MAVTLTDVYKQMFNELLSPNTKINVGTNFHTQVKQINKLLRNDTSAMTSTIVDFMVQSACVPMHFESKNATLNNIFNNWLENVNSDINKDIPSGFRSLSEQYFRERWESSFIVLNINWGKIDGYEMPIEMWFANGGSIYAKRENDDLRNTQYYLGKNTESPLGQGETTVIVRKPYNHWYDLYPTPYLVKKGALYHALLKEKLIDKQAQGLAQVFPSMLAIKMGCAEALKTNKMPTKEEMEAMKNKFKNLDKENEDRTINGGLVGAFPFDVNFENILPDFMKIMDEKIFAGTDRNLLMALGLIEFKGFSTNREEAVLNPKPLVSEVEDAVEDFKELMKAVVKEIRKRNSGAKKFSAKEIQIVADPIKALLTDAMKALIRSLYDRGLIAKETIVEGVTNYKFASEVEKRKKETKDDLDTIMEAPVILNQDNDSVPSSNPNTEQQPEKKKSEKQTAQLEEETKDLSDEEKELFISAYTECSEKCTELDCDEDFIHKTALEWANKVVKEYIEAPYTKTNYPPQIKNLPVGARNLWIRVFNQVLKDTGDEDKARQVAWHEVGLKYKKGPDGKYHKIKKS